MAGNNSYFLEAEAPPVSPVWEVMTELASCLCRELAADGGPEPCFCGIYPGEQVPYDYCGECSSTSCGQAWVRLVTSAPSDVFPVPSGFGNCVSPLAFQVEVGVLRCAPSPDEQGHPPSMTEQFEAARLQYADMMAMKRAIVCCAKLSRRDMSLSSYLPRGPMGACLGGVWLVSFSEI